MNRFALSSRPRSMANIAAQILFVLFTILFLFVLGLTYRYSTITVNREVERNLAQTASSIQNLFDYKISMLRLHQNGQAKSVILTNMVQRGEISQIDEYFYNVENADHINTPDFRFIKRNNQLLWDDGNASFFGITEAQIDQLGDKVVYNESWHFIQSSITNGQKHLLVRKMPMIEREIGEVLGHFYIVVVLDNNSTLVERFKKVSASDQVILLAYGEPIASTEKNSSQVIDKFRQDVQAESFENRDLLYSRVELEVDGVASPVEIYTVQNNSGILLLEDSYKIGLLVSLLTIAVIVLLVRIYIKKSIASELKTLMSYTQVAKKLDEVEPFPGSQVLEFDHIGRTLEKTFSELIEKEQRFQDLFNYALSPIVVWAADGEIVQMNPAAQNSFQADSDIIDHCFSRFQSDIASYIEQAAFGKALTGINIPIADTVYRWNIAPIRIDNRVKSIIGQGLDITSLVKAEKQSNLARVEAEKAAEARADFLAKMSHEIRTPLNGILGVAQLLKSADLKQPDMEKIDVLYHSGEHLLAVLNDILDFSRMEQGKLKIVSNEFLFQPLVHSLQNIYQPLCLEKNIELHIESEVGANTVILSDQVRINQILFNLLSNSVKFTRQGEIKAHFFVEKIDLAVNDVEQNTHLDSLAANKQQILQIVIKDSGIGISKANLEHIFDPFVQAEKTITREYGGSGLGLAIVKSLVDMLNGDIAITSEEHIGTEVSIRLPVEVVHSPASSDPKLDGNKNDLDIDSSIAPPVSENQTEQQLAKDLIINSACDSADHSTNNPSTNKTANANGNAITDKLDTPLFNNEKKLLLVEDNHTNAFIARAFFEKYGFQVTRVEDGEEAIAKLEQISFDLIIMDNHMPNLGGIETTRLIRQQLKVTTPIYACTADEFESTRSAFIEAGADFIIVKPIKEATLTAALRYFKQHYC